MAEETLADIRADIATIDARITAIRQFLHDHAEQSQGNAWLIAERGQRIGAPGYQLDTGAHGFEAPTVHPVWAPEVAFEARTLQAMGSATFEYEPLYRDLAAWAEAGRLTIDSEQDWQQHLPAIEMDVTNPDMGVSWQAQLALLDTRLEALSRQESISSHHHGQGMEY